MTNRLKRVLDKLLSNSKILFLVDSVGALITAFILVIITTIFKVRIGLPCKTLYLLSIIAGAFAIFSIYCFCFVKFNWRPFLTIIAAANTLYCLSTAVLLVVYFDRMPRIAISYFVAEIIIMSSLVLVELKSASMSKETVRTKSVT